MASSMRDRIDEIMKKHSCSSQQISDYIKNKHSSTNRSLNQNDIATLLGFITQLDQLMVTMGDIALVGSSINQSISEQIKESINNVDQNRPTFAQVVREKESFDKFVQRKQEQTQENTIVLSAKTNCSPVDVLKEVNNCIKGMRDNNSKVKINRIIKSKTGAVIKTDPKENIDTLIARFRSSDKLDKCARIFTPTQLDPTIVLKGVDKLTEYKDLPSILCNMNYELTGREKKMKVLFAIRSNFDRHDVVLRVSPATYQIIMSMTKIHTDRDRIERWHDKVMVRQCQKCYRFDHKTRNCNAVKRCVNCSSTEHSDCNNAPKCINCSTHPKFNSHIDHHPNNRLCPIYKQQINNLIERTCYHDLDHDMPNDHPVTSSENTGRNNVRS